MVKRTPKRDIDINELKHEFDLEVNRCQSYFELMYKTFNFSFAAIVALVGFVCSLYGIDTQPEYKDFLVGVILYFAIPACLYVFGIMYTYNAYSLAVCGKRAERLHNELINKDWFMTLLDLEDYIKTKDKVFEDYADRETWMKKVVVNIAKAGFFSSDRTIAQYNEDIWHL